MSMQLSMVSSTTETYYQGEVQKLTTVDILTVFISQTQVGKVGLHHSMVMFSFKNNGYQLALEGDGYKYDVEIVSTADIIVAFTSPVTDFNTECTKAIDPQCKNTVLSAAQINRMENTITSGTINSYP